MFPAPAGASHTLVTPDPRDWAPSSGLIGTRHTGGAHAYAGKIPVHIK